MCNRDAEIWLNSSPIVLSDMLDTGLRIRGVLRKVPGLGMGMPLTEWDWLRRSEPMGGKIKSSSG